MLRVADRVALIENGRIVHQATPAELSAEPDILLRPVASLMRELPVLFQEGRPYCRMTA